MKTILLPVYASSTDLNEDILNTQLTDWFTNKIATNLALLPDQIDLTKSLTHYGLDSITDMEVVGELSEWLGYELSTYILYQYETLEMLIKHLQNAYLIQRLPQK